MSWLLEPGQAPPAPGSRDAQNGREPLGVHGSSHEVRPAEMVLAEGLYWYDQMRGELVARW